MEEPRCPTCDGRLTLLNVDVTDLGAVKVESECPQHGEAPLLLVFPQVLSPDQRGPDVPPPAQR